MYQLTERCPEIIILQRLDTGLYDYSEGETFEGAWKIERDEYWAWVEEEIEEHGAEAVKQEFLDSLEHYYMHEALAAAYRGEDWPLTFGYVEWVPKEDA